jgi:hypothetical protein
LINFNGNYSIPYLTHHYRGRYLIYHDMNDKARSFVYVKFGSKLILTIRLYKKYKRKDGQKHTHLQKTNTPYNS